MGEVEALIERLLDSAKKRYGSAATERLEMGLSPGSPQFRRHRWQKEAGFVFPGLPQTGWHDERNLTIVEQLERNWESILQEMWSVVSSGHGFQNYVAMGSDQSVIPPEWKAFYFKQGPRDCSANHQRCPRTARLVMGAPRVADNVFLSALNPGGTIAPHAAESNVLLNVHLGVVVPDGCEIRVGSLTRKWTAGKCLVFDASFEHEVWNRSDSTRFVLFLDVWHPDLTDVEVECLSAFRAGVYATGLRRQAETGVNQSNQLDGKSWWRGDSNVLVETHAPGNSQ